MKVRDLVKFLKIMFTFKQRTTWDYSMGLAKLRNIVTQHMLPVSLLKVVHTFADVNKLVDSVAENMISMSLLWI